VIDGNPGSDLVMSLDRCELHGLPERGVYALIVEAPHDLSFEAGGLGAVELSRGVYVYVGSAIGRRGSPLRRRVARHLSSDKRLRWHIDYLLASRVKVAAVVAAEATDRVECRLVGSLIALGLEPSVKGFGSSDCKCRAHLLKSPLSPERTATLVCSALRGLGLTPRSMLIGR